MRGLNSVWEFGSRRPQQGGEVFAAGALTARGEDATQGGKSSEIHVVQKRSVGDEKSGARVFELIAYLALSIRRIEQCGDTSGERGSVIGDGEFPGVGKEDSNDFSGSESSGDEAMGKAFNEAAIFGEGETMIAGSVNQRCLAAVLAATLEDDMVDEAPGGIGVELGAKHWW